MRTQRVLLAAVCGVGIVGFGPTVLGQNVEPMPPLERRDAPQPNRQDVEAAAIKQILREVTNASFTKGGFDDIIERFAEADRTRLGKDSFTEEEHEVLDGRIAQTYKDWKAKYNQDFNLVSAATVFGSSFASIVHEPGAVTASERQAPATPLDETQRRTGTPPAERPADTADAAQYSDTATVVIAASHGLPEVRVPMRREGMGRWKIDIPDSYTAREFHDNLLKQLTTFDEQNVKWPANQDEAYRMAAHRVLLAVTNTDEKPMDKAPVDKPPAAPPMREQEESAPFPKPSETPAPRP